MLHSTFWNHGVEDLGLPPWAISMFPMPSDLPLKNDSTFSNEFRSRKTDEWDRQANSSSASDGAFLDFLYPPQALARLQRANKQQWHRWEKRNAQRLPEGFVLASRGFASRSSEQHAFAKAAMEESIEQAQLHETFMDDTGQFGEVARDQVNLPKVGQEVSENTFEDTLPNQRMVSSGTTAGGYASNDHDDISSESAFADSPAELADGVDAVKRLRNALMLSQDGSNQNADKSVQNTESVWKIYSHLQAQDRIDNKLKADLAQWLSDQHNKGADVHCLELYHSTPKPLRALGILQDVLPVILRRKSLRQAAQLHKEALQTNEDCYHISRTIFEEAVEKSWWRLAMQIEADYHAKYRDDESNKSRVSHFWKDVSKIPQLLSKAIDLAKFLEGNESVHLAESHTRSFCTAFFKEAISQEFLRQDASLRSTTMLRKQSPPRAKIRSFFRHISRMESKEYTVRFFEDVMLAMIRRDSTLNYAQFHHVTSYVYSLYRRVHKATPPEWLLMMLLQRITKYTETLHMLQPTWRSLTIKGVVDDWKRYHRRLSEKAVERLIVFYARCGDVDEHERWMEYLQGVYGSSQTRIEILWTRIYVHAQNADPVKAHEAFKSAKRIAAKHNEKPDIKCWGSLLHAHERADDLEGGMTTLQDLVDHSGLKPDPYSFHTVLQMLAKRGDAEGTEELLRQYDRLVGKARETALVGSLITAHVENEDMQKAEAILRETIARVRAGEIRGSLLGCFNILMTAYSRLRDIDATLGTYRWMKVESIKPDEDSFAALIQGLAFYRRTDVAQKIVRTIMPENEVLPTALHYTIVIAGYTNQRQYRKAVVTYEQMLMHNIKPTSASHIAYFKAKTKAAHISTPADDGGEAVPLEETINELERLIRGDVESATSSKQSTSRRNAPQLFGTSPAAYFDILIFTHGERRCIEAVRELYRRYKENVEARGNAQEVPPIQLMGSLMEAHRRGW